MLMMKRIALPVWVILACLRLSYSECPNGWFGFKCQYKCRCTENKCDPLTETCLDGASCQPGWFGPACQYVDLAQSYADVDRRLPVNLIIDGKENTCLSANEVTLSLTVPLQLSWFRAYVREPYFLNKLNIQFKEQINSSLLACGNKRTALFSDTALDIHCDLDVKVSQVILTGGSVQALCSFYISGGRNVALRQHTAQSSNYDVARAPASNGVDGDTNNVYFGGSCTHTTYGDNQPTWNVTFYNPRAVNRYVIYNRNEGIHVDDRLIGFHLRSYDSAGAEVFHFIDTSPTEQTVYTVSSLTTEVQTVSIYIHKMARSYEQFFLTVCEVEVYGDSVCEPGLYGRDCEHNCHCANSRDTCFVSTGGCPSGCPPGFQGESCTEVCKKGWFGASCQYKCHCVLDLCSPADGSCTQGVSCTSGWFGPSCQYEDLVQSVTLDQTLLPPVIRDNNDNTCIDDTTQKLIITWTIPYEFTWLRAVVKDPDFLSTLSLQFMTNTSSQSMNCSNQLQAKVDDRTIDIHCDLGEVVKQVIVTGEGVKYLCSLYISGGRNVALKQKSKQSSTFLQLLTSQSRSAVDGNKDSNFAHGSCTHTDYHDNSPSWSVFLSRNLSVNRYVLYNRDKDSHRLQGFLLESYSEEGINVFQFKDITPTFQNVYTITTAPVSPISRVIIKAARSSALDAANYLTLCEVEIFGDTVCEPGLYGRDCEHKCACADRNNTCFVSTGGCPSGCAPGFHGESCDQVCRNGTHGPECGSSCSQFCRMDDLNTTACDHVHGACLYGCKPGYAGSMCYEECENGHYGQDCNATCPRLCLANVTSELRVCHHVNGTCLRGCQVGYLGLLCNETCSSGTYGQDCSSVCSQLCEVGNMSQSVCDHIHGTCLLGCQAGYLGSTCDELCENGSYGPVCSLYCPEHCKVRDVGDTICHHTNGTCLQGCQDGYVGPMCNESCDDGTYGEDCRSSCSQFCVKGVVSESVCDHTDGGCLHGCQAGYQGPKCDEQCDRQTHGQDCNSTCPQHCENMDTSLSVCHHISGVCTQGCLPGYKGGRCDEQCDRQTHGQDCNSTCPQHCENMDTSLSVCHHISGVCTQGCLPGYKGDRCDEQCDRQTHGQDCNSTCPQHCENMDTSLSVCHHISGVCTQGCLPGYKGVHCDEQCDRQTHGQDCNSTCPQHCENMDTSLSVCHHISGVCTQGCLPGYKGVHCDEQCDRQTHGQDCNSTCPKHCENMDTSLSVCHHISGVCTQGCLPGYKGVHCDEQCDRQTHGQDCNSTCPQHCENMDTSLSVCHHKSGVCTQGCLPGYKGDRCDEQCDRETHGQDCNSICPQHCENMDTSQSVCHHISGVCTQGCLPGYKGVHCDEQCDRQTHGQDCNSTCPQHCENMDTSLSVCHHISGVCTQGCLPGYKGDRCDEQCDRETHGQDCNSICPQHCENMDTSQSVCHHISGVCTQGCLPGYKGVHCDEQCDRQTHGQDCNSTCPQHCENMDTSLSVCHHISGVCTQGCLPGYKGVHCDEQCDRQTHGQDCNSTCPQHCENMDTSLSVCHHISGVCTQGCLPGHKGDRCDEPKTDVSRIEESLHGYSTTLWAVSGCIMVVVVGLIVLWRFKKWKSFKIWTTRRKKLQKSGSSEIIVTTEMSVVDQSVLHG